MSRSPFIRTVFVKHFLFCPVTEHYTMHARRDTVLRICELLGRKLKPFGVLTKRVAGSTTTPPETVHVGSWGRDFVTLRGGTEGAHHMQQWKNTVSRDIILL